MNDRPKRKRPARVHRRQVSRRKYITTSLGTITWEKLEEYIIGAIVFLATMEGTAWIVWKLYWG